MKTDKKKPKKLKKERKKKWQELTRRQCFISVISTGYKLYFYQFWLMWSCLRKNTLNEQNCPVGLKWVCSHTCQIWVVFFFFFPFILSTYFVYLCKDTCDEWTLCLRFRAAWGRDSAQESEQKFQQQARLAVKHQTSDFSALYIVFETVEYQHIVFIISHCWL